MSDFQWAWVVRLENGEKPWRLSMQSVSNGLKSNSEFGSFETFEELLITIGEIALETELTLLQKIPNDFKEIS